MCFSPLPKHRSDWPFARDPQSAPKGEGATTLRNFAPLSDLVILRVTVDFGHSPCGQDQCFHVLPSQERSEPNTPKLRSASQVHSSSLPSRECPKLRLRLTPPMGLSHISLQVCRHSLPPPGPRSPGPSVYQRCSKGRPVHSVALPMMAAAWPRTVRHLLR